MTEPPEGEWKYYRCGEFKVAGEFALVATPLKEKVAGDQKLRLAWRRGGLTVEKLPAGAGGRAVAGAAVLHGVARLARLHRGRDHRVGDALGGAVASLQGGAAQPQRVAAQVAGGRLAADMLGAPDFEKRATGIEPALQAWKAYVQPLHHARADPMIGSLPSPIRPRGTLRLWPWKTNSPS